MRFLKILSVLTGVQLLVISGCSGGGSNGDSTAPSLQKVSASVTTSISGAQAVSKLIVSGVPTNMCGYDAVLLSPPGVTVKSVNSSGVAQGSLVAFNSNGQTLKVAAASGSGFSSGEVATITFDITGGDQISDLSISSFTPRNCP